MLCVYCEHQAIEKAAALGSGLVEQPVHRRRQPDHTQMIGESRDRRDRLPVDPAEPLRRQLLHRRGDAGAKRGETESAFDFRRNGPGAVALAESHLLQRRAAQAAPGRQEGNRLDQIGLARAVGAYQHDRFGAEFNRQRAIAAEVAEREAQNAGGIHAAVLRLATLSHKRRG